MRKVLIYWCFLILIGCTEKADIQLDYSESVVINLLLNPDTAALFTPILSIPVEGREIKPLTDLEISFYENGDEFETVIYDQAMEGYRLTGALSTGQTYSVQFEFAGKEVTAETYIPDSINLGFVASTPLVYRTAFDQPYNQINLQIIDPAGEQFYMVRVRCKNYDFNHLWDPNDTIMHFHAYTYNSLRSTDPVILSEAYFPHTVQDDQKSFPFLVFSDRLFDGEKYNLSLYYSTPFVVTGKGVYMYDHHIELFVYSISEEMYQYMSSYLLQSDSRSGNILSGRLDPVNVYSNIENGYGIFGGYVSYLDTSQFVPGEIFELSQIKL